jgi:hypothetical protein
MGGDAHLYYASKEYVFERPPQFEGGEGFHTAAAAAFVQHPLDVGSTANSAAAGGSPTTAASAATATLGSAWMAYESAEFTPWEEVFLDATAWMIAVVLCYDPTRHQREQEEANEDDEDHVEPRRRHRHEVQRSRQIRRVSHKNREQEEKPEHSTESNNSDNKQDDERN